MRLHAPVGPAIAHRQHLCDADLGSDPIDFEEATYYRKLRNSGRK
jgi:hypothetical protein